MRAAPVLPHLTPKAWPHVEAWVKAALSRGAADHTPNAIRAHLERGTMQLWLAWDNRPRGCCITELVDTPRGRTCNLVVVAGEQFETWAHLEADVARWAAAWGATHLTMTGRPGWQRRLAKHGWTTRRIVTLEKRIDDENSNASTADCGAGAEPARLRPVHRDFSLAG